METLETRYGNLPVDGPVDRYRDGSLRAVSLDGPVALETSLGRLTPQHTIDDSRRMQLPQLTFFPNGQVRSLPLETSTVVDTPVGELPAELVTFHENGAVARVFPLNGKLSGYWTEADEAGLAETLSLDTSIGRIASRFVSVAFSPDGELRSLTLWPGEEVTVKTPVGNAPARLGLSFHSGGALRSLEPARPMETPTPAGVIWAYDPDAVGISGDENSLAFDLSGTVSRVATIRSQLVARLPGEAPRELAPAVRESICGDGDHEITPLVLEFTAQNLVARHGSIGKPFAVLPRANATFVAKPFVSAFAVSFAPKRCSM
ncbi:conserved hypothetical protein [Solidesulfovibrio fructosivorans JJ]]|uniref:Uncharacterized protein n=1 Tax=Solidesulfovibrio fructosivorans JJ] TaxID=596151 RepID=E1K0N6_SOLFR|nr:hypothetical protein [Solidesulfovibrio fructosivorans]EFL49800.1 conserved hypothetical protein [Solidesulfovibrio fructosivorans JJ]]